MLLAYHGGVGLAFLAYVVGPVLAAVFVYRAFRRRRTKSCHEPQGMRRRWMAVIRGLAGLWGGFGLGFLVCVLSQMLLSDLIQDELHLAYACGSLFAVLFVGGTTVRLMNRRQRAVLANIGRGISLSSLIGIGITAADYSWKVNRSDESLLGILLGLWIVVLVGIAIFGCIVEAFAATESG